MSTRRARGGRGTRARAGRAGPNGLRRAALAAIALWSTGSPGAEPVAPAPSSSPPPARVHLEYRRERAAKGCVSAPQLQADVEARLGRPVFAPSGEAELTARVAARRRRGRFVIHMELFDRDGQRLGQRELSTRAAHCSALDDSLALVLSLAADMPRASAEAPAPEPPAPEPPGTAAPASARPAQPRGSLGTPLSIPATTHAPRHGLRLRPTLGGGALLGPLPALAPGLELGLELRAGSFWPVAIRGSGWAGQRHTSPAAAGGGAEFSARMLALSVCPYTAPLGSFELSMCAVQWLGRVTADGFGVAEAERASRWVLAFGAGATLSRQLGQVFVSASAELLVPAPRRRYVFTDVPDLTLYTEPWIQGATVLRVGAEF